MKGARSNNIVHGVIFGDFNAGINEAAKLTIKVTANTNFNHFSSVFHFLCSFLRGLLALSVYIIAHLFSFVNSFL